LEIGRHGSDEETRLAFVRQAEFQLGRVEELPLDGQTRRASTVDTIPHDGATQECQVNPDLVGATRQGHNLK
jgi:hypothetical protein